MSLETDAGLLPSDTRLNVVWHDVLPVHLHRSDVSVAWHGQVVSWLLSVTLGTRGAWVRLPPEECELRGALSECFPAKLLKFTLASVLHTCLAHVEHRGTRKAVVQKDLTAFCLFMTYSFYRATRMHSADYAVTRCHTLVFVLSSKNFWPSHNFIHLLKRQHNYTQKNESENLTNQQHKTLKRYLPQSTQWRHIVFRSRKFLQKSTFS